MTAVSGSGLHLTCTNATDHGGFRRDRHRRHLLIAVFALSITANRARGHLLYRRRAPPHRSLGPKAHRGAEPNPVGEAALPGSFCNRAAQGSVHFASISGVHQWRHLTHSDYPWQFRIEVSASADVGSTPSPGTSRKRAGEGPPGAGLDEMSTSRTATDSSVRERC